ncbi:MAG: hypothetical protein JST22_16995 [Bacteroidetes bacterium]|nr:hypothetical protein [Bacteroidota bacterium]
MTMVHKLLVALLASFLPVVVTAQTGGSASSSSAPASHSIGTPASGTAGHTVGTASSRVKNTTVPARPVAGGATTVHAIGVTDAEHRGPHRGRGKHHGRMVYSSPHFIGSAGGRTAHRPPPGWHGWRGKHKGWEKRHVHGERATVHGTAPRGNVGNALPSRKFIGTARTPRSTPAPRSAPVQAPQKNVGKALPSPKSIGTARTPQSPSPPRSAPVQAPKKNVGKALPAPKSIGTGGGGAQSVPSAGAAPKMPVKRTSPIGNAVGTGSHAQPSIGSAAPQSNRKAVQCKGIMQDGTRCTRMTTDASGYCPSHKK